MRFEKTNKKEVDIVANKNGATVQSVMRALDILTLFERNSELSLSEISNRMTLSKSTVYGLVNTLVVKGFLEQYEETKKYKLGIKNFELGSCVQNRMDLRAEARPYLESLYEKFHEAIHVAKHYDGEVVYIDKISGLDFTIVSSQIGYRAPMHCTGVGKVLLAYLPEEYLKKHILSKGMKKYTGNTITIEEELLQELDVIRKQGYACDNEEIEIGVSCVAVPVFGQGGKILAGISVSAPTGRMNDEKKEEILRELIRCSQLISRHMGYSRKI